MWWREFWVDARRLYLGIQRDLGGSEVVLQAGTTAERVSPPRRPSAPAAPETAVASRAETPAVRRDWREGAPPIPENGLVITIPAPDILAAGPDYSSLEEIAAAVAKCTRCVLCDGRTNTVPGEGNPQARLLCVGEGPGETEDRTGRPFVGRAGELLTGILAAIELPREQVFIANVVKCRPPQNRKPLPGEMTACLPYLQAQLRLIRPTVILALGATAAEALLGVRRSLGELRNKVHRYDGVPLVVTYHPAALLRNPNWKKPTWDDVRIARQLLDA